MLDYTLQRLAASPSSRVERLVLAIGDRSGVEPDSVAFYFELLSHDTATEGPPLLLRPPIPEMPGARAGAARRPRVAAFHRALRAVRSPDRFDAS